MAAPRQTLFRRQEEQISHHYDVKWQHTHTNTHRFFGHEEEQNMKIRRYEMAAHTQTNTDRVFRREEEQEMTIPRYGMAEHTFDTHSSGAMKGKIGRYQPIEKSNKQQSTVEQRATKIQATMRWNKKKTSRQPTMRWNQKRQADNQPSDPTKIDKEITSLRWNQK